MTRLRTDQACLEAQMQQQIAQGLNAELAVPCPDCGVESGRACRDSLDRAVRTHLARSVAANRRDTEPCPAPSILIDRHALADGDYDGMSLKSLERASARAFAESMATNSIWFGDGSTVECPHCKAPPGVRCSSGYSKGLLAEWGGTHFSRLDAAKTPAASERAPAIAPEAVPFHGPSISEMLPRPVCACGQTIWNELTVCGDCRAENVSALLCMPQPAPLDQRIREAQPDDAAECAWSTPTSEGEGWT